MATRKKTGVDMLPWSDDGKHLQHYARRGDEDTRWESNLEFPATLRLVGTSRGRSAAYFNWVQDTTGQTYPMFMSSMADLLGSDVVVRGVASGRWIGVKRGENYGIAWVGPHHGMEVRAEVIANTYGLLSGGGR